MLLINHWTQNIYKKEWSKTGRQTISFCKENDRAEIFLLVEGYRQVALAGGFPDQLGKTIWTGQNCGIRDTKTTRNIHFIAKVS